MNPKPAKLAILISGSGTTMLNLAKVISDGRLSAEICGVISSRNDAAGVIRAQNLGIPATIIHRKDFASAALFSAAITNCIDNLQVDLVCMAGFLCFWSIPPHWVGRTLNIHPSLLPKFGGRGMHGLHVHQAVIASGEQISGCTVHFADNEYDHGPIILQRSCPVLPGDTPTSLAARVFQEEIIAYPEAINQIWTGQSTALPPC